MDRIRKAIKHSSSNVLYFILSILVESALSLLPVSILLVTLNLLPSSPFLHLYLSASICGSLSFESALFKLFPSLFGLARQIARQGFDRDIVGSAELTPEQKARVVLSRLVRDLIRQLRRPTLFILPQFLFPRFFDRWSRLCGTRQFSNFSGRNSFASQFFEIKFLLRAEGTDMQNMRVSKTLAHASTLSFDIKREAAARPFWLSVGYSPTISFLRLVTKASTSSFSFFGTLYLSSASARCLAASSQSLSVMPSPVWTVFISRPV
jgi:hypothetical protein